MIMDWSTIFFIISLLFACIHFLLPKKTHGKLPPGPIPLPIVGSLFQLGTKPNESLAKLAKTHGPLMSLKLGSKTILVVSNANMAQQVLQKHDQAFAGRTVMDAVRVLNHSDSSMVWLQPNLRWRKIRALCNTQILTAQRLDANIGLRSKKVQELLSHVRENCLNQQAVDIGRAAFVTTLNLISNTVFSVDLIDIKSDSVQEFRDLVWRILEEAGKPNVSDYFPLLRRLDLQGIRRRSMELFKRLHQVFDEMIDQRLLSRSSNNSTRRNDFLDVLLYQTPKSGSELNRQEIKALFADIFVAGSDTTSTTVEWAMAELLHNPDAMAKARLELKETIAIGKQVEESDIARLPYLQAIVKEALRLHPPVPLLIPHRAESTEEICGFTIPKHTQVIVNAWAIGRDDHVWMNPASFLPERFLDTKVDFRGQDFELIPFGAGRRICPGLPLAFRMVHLMLASLLHSFAWKLPDGMAPEEMNMADKFGITLQLEVPLRAISLLE